MKVVDLFSGIGGFSLAAHWVGWNTVSFCEWDKFCQQVLDKNFNIGGPRIPIFGDIDKFSYAVYKSWMRKNRPDEKDRSVDVVCGGFPCQGFSTAGKRGGVNDHRYKWPQMFRIVREFRPAWVVAENVAGLISMDGGAVLKQIYADLESEGYEVQSFVIPAIGVGAPHRRDRIWIVANSSSAGLRGSRGICDLRKLDGRASKQGETDRLETSDQVCRQNFNQPLAHSQGEQVFTTTERGLQPELGDDHRRPTTDAEQPQFKGSNGLQESTGPNHGDREDWVDSHPTRIGIQGDGTSGQQEPRIQAGEGLSGCDYSGGWEKHWYEVATEFCGVFNGFSRGLDPNRLKDGTSNQAITGQDMPHLWHIFQQKAFQWEIRGRIQIFKPEELFAVLWKYFSQSHRSDNLSFQSEEVQRAFLRNMWVGTKPGCPPQGWEYQEQYAREYSDALSQLSHEIALVCSEEIKRYTKGRTQRLKALGNAIVPQVAYQIFKAINDELSKPDLFSGNGTHTA